MKGLTMMEASWSQQDDLPIFTNALTNPDHMFGPAKYFVMSVIHYIDYLLRPTLEELRIRIARQDAYASFRRNDKDIRLSELVKLAKYSCEKTFASVSVASIHLGIVPFAITTIDHAPTASLRELLLKILVNQPDKVTTIMGDLPKSIANASQHKPLLRDPKSDRAQYDITMNVADGVPRIFFICLHKPTVRAALLCWGQPGELERGGRDPENPTQGPGTYVSRARRPWPS